MRHEWETDGFYYEIMTDSQEHALGFTRPPPVALEKETLRLAERVRELEAVEVDLRNFIGDKVEIICNGCGSRFMTKDAYPLMAEPCDGCRRWVDRETEIRFLRRERRLLIDQDQARCRVMQGVIGGAVRAADIEDVQRLGNEILALHLEASEGVERPNGSPCQCILCAPRRDRKPATTIQEEEN